MTFEFTFRDGTTTTDTIEWAKKYEDSEYRRVALDEFVSASGAHWKVSTIWQGMPSLGLGDGRPRIFETAIFHNGELLGEVHHATEAEAKGAHADIVDAIANARDLSEFPGIEM